MPMLDTERHGRVLVVRIDHPPHNFMTAEMVRELQRVVYSLRGDHSVGAVVITGKPDDLFVTHYDVGEILHSVQRAGISAPPWLTAIVLRIAGAVRRVPILRDLAERTPLAAVFELYRIHDLFLEMNRSDKVFIAAINGIASGGGCELALACDLRIISDQGGPIGQPEILLGLIPGGGGSQRLTRLLGTGRALELILEGRVLGPHEAAEIGLVHRVVPAAELMSEATATAERLARRPPGSVGAAKRTVYEGGSAELDRGLHMERAEFLSVTAAEPGLRAMRAYVAELKQRGGPPIADEDAIARWLDGTAVDLTE